MGAGLVIDVTDATFAAEVLNSKTLTLVDFWAVWCGPCRAIAPILQELADAHPGKLKVCKVNVDDNLEVAQRYRVTAIPTLLLIKDGEVIQQLVGGKPKKVFEELISKHI